LQVRAFFFPVEVLAEIMNFLTRSRPIMVTQTGKWSSGAGSAQMSGLIHAADHHSRLIHPHGWRMFSMTTVYMKGR